MSRKKKYQNGGNPLLGGLLGSLTSQASVNYPEAMRVGQTRPEEIANMAAAEQGRHDAINYIKSDRYKKLLLKELKKSKASDYPNQVKPSFEELYTERLSRVEQSPLQHIEKSPYIWDYTQQTGYGGQNLSYPGAKGKVISSTYANPLFDPSVMTEAGVPVRDQATEFRQLGLEEALHGSHNPFYSKGNTSIPLAKPGIKDTGKRFKNITPYARDIIKSNTVAPENITDFPEGLDAEVIKQKQDYTVVPTEIITQIPKVLGEGNVKGKFRNKDFNTMINNPTISSERLLNATSGSMNPFEKLQQSRQGKSPEEKKFYKETRKKTKEILNNIAMGEADSIPVAKYGGQMNIKQLIKKYQLGGTTQNQYMSYMMEEPTYAKNAYDKYMMQAGMIPQYFMGGFFGAKDQSPEDKQKMQGYQQMIGNVGTAGSGAINSTMDWKQREGYDVSGEPIQKGMEAGFGSNPMSSMFMGIGKMGEGAVDKAVPGLGESIFSPHKKYLRAWREKNPRYLIPVAGSIIAAADEKKEMRAEEVQRQTALNPYGDSQFRNGGELIKYNAPSHENGGQMITANGTPTNNPNQAVAEIEKQETMHEGYIFSDTLKHKSGKTFADVSKAIEKHFKNKRGAIEQRTKRMQMDMLKAQNEKTRQQVETMTNGGSIPKYNNGGGVLAYKEPEYTLAGVPVQFNPVAQYSTEPIATLSPSQLQVPTSEQNKFSQGLANLGDPNVQAKEVGIPGLTFRAQTSYPFTGRDTTPLKTIDPSSLSIPYNSETVSKVDAPTLTQETSKKGKLGTDYLTPARIGKGIEMAGKAGILASGYDKVNPQLNPNAKAAADLMRKRKINTQALLNQINLQRNAALASNQNARSLNVKRGLDQRTFASAAQQAMMANLSEQQANANFRAQEAQTLAALGSEEARAKAVADDLTARNKGQWLTNLGTVLGDVGRAGAFETKVKVNDMQVAEGLSLLGAKYERFGVDADTYQRLKSGKYTSADVKKLEESIIRYKGNE